MISGAPSEIEKLLSLHYGGDDTAIEKLCELLLDDLIGYVRNQLGRQLRRRLETMDVVQDAMIEFLRFAPRITTRSEERFRSIIRRIALNAVRGQADRFRTLRRRLSAERRLPSGSALDIDTGRHRLPAGPDAILEHHETEAWMHLALELLSPEDQDVIQMRVYESRSFPQIGESLGVTEDTARMRHGRAINRLTRTMVELRSGVVGDPRKRRSHDHRHAW